MISKEFSKFDLDGIHSFLDPCQPHLLFTITKKITRYVLAKNQFSWCSPTQLCKKLSSIINFFGWKVTLFSLQLEYQQRTNSAPIAYKQHTGQNGLWTILWTLNHYQRNVIILYTTVHVWLQRADDIGHIF